MLTVLDFHVRLGSPDHYSLDVFARGSSQPLARGAFDYPLSFLTEFALRGLEPDFKDAAARINRLEQFGRNLYQKLFSEDVERVWKEHKAASEFIVLCLRIAPVARGLEALPWETLHDGEEFIAAGGKTGLTRLPLDLAPQADLPPVELPLRMFALVSSPLDLGDNERLAMEREQEILLEAVNTPAGQGRLRVDFEDEAKLDILESDLDAGYHILHYTGHGIPPEDGGGLLLEDSEGQGRPVSVSEFLGSLQKAQTTLRLAVLSGCQTARTLHTGGFRDLARGLLGRGVPAVIAMQFSISDAGGLKFAESLYKKIIEGQPLENYERALKSLEELNDRRGIAACLLQIGAVLRRRGKYEESLHSFERSLVIYQDLSDHQGVAACHSAIGQVFGDLQEADKALEHFRSSLLGSERLGDRQELPVRRTTSA